MPVDKQGCCASCGEPVQISPYCDDAALRAVFDAAVKDRAEPSAATRVVLWTLVDRATKGT